MGKKLVVGASGFLGSHVTKQLVARGDDVRVLIRRTSSTRGIDGLPVERHYGDVFDDDAVRGAMAGCDVVFYCVVDARAWLLDPTPLWRTNVEGLRRVLDIAADADLHRFVFTSSIATIGISADGPATEDHPHNWLDRAGDYVRTRVDAEKLVLTAHHEKGLPAVAMCVSNTYGPDDWVPTPHGALVSAAVRGRMPFYIDGAQSEVVGVQDAARALILAGDRGRPGERYIVSESFMTAREIYEHACRAVDVTPPRRGVPIGVLAAAAAVNAPIARLRRRDTALTPLSIRLMHIMSPMDHSKAERELGWQPAPTAGALGEAARFFVSHRRRSAGERR
ncbi:NAD-dependent epimerase/dehydratase family protein [Mycolicibacterium sp. S2-37]|uniref:NAD-dependent epimerase/dehydratase family protein n=1 Tax=Mycolicibacterium sp. S2-37 TaxID=2810297 RepID=UPI001A9451C3|nr:NAD-dependent epimerase/dehydratase family protein [Mycolicibacterium sp. S2-37]MBO0680015.1 NAD-dependent epimerase/dehydratase family protein [Mycolicibacterium sp. S2-37]